MTNGSRRQFAASQKTGWDGCTAELPTNIFYTRCSPGENVNYKILSGDVALGLEKTHSALHVTEKGRPEGE